MKFLYTALFGLLTLSAVRAQIDQPAFGPSYADMTFYKLEDGATVSVPHTAWDIAFSAAGQGLGIFLNEGAASSQGSTSVELYLTTAEDFESTDTSNIDYRLYNDELSWNEGAFNHVKNSLDPFDFGWGRYDVTTHIVNGSRYFILKLRNGSYKKLFVESLAGGVYTIRYADLDGSDETTKTIDKAGFAGKTLAWFSFGSETAADLEPAAWDLLFTRYTTPLDDGEGGILEYMVSGVLSGPGVQVAQADGINPATVDFNDYSDNLTDSLTAVGYDWKEFNLSTFQWSIPDDRVYFILTAADSLWKVQFIDFEGSGTGVSTLEKTFLSVLSATSDFPENLNGFDVFPNPATDEVHIAIDLTGRPEQAVVQLYNSMGQLMLTRELQTQAGLNMKTLQVGELPAGTYFLAFQTERGRAVKPLVVR